uniref:SH3 domain-containing protein n=1 Tax=Romanomermis culicivorax TaxID=13658 RepID=A0A915J9Q6_ROMCU
YSSKNVVVVPNRHAYRVPPCKYNSFESDDTVQSSNSASPCPSSVCGSTLMLPSNSYAVTHDYYAKFQDEIDLRVGERVLVVDTSDPDWWQIVFAQVDEIIGEGLITVRTERDHRVNCPLKHLMSLE